MAGQLVAVCALPAITRLYSPADMGYYGLLLSYIGLASVAVSLKYETAIMTPAEPDEGVRLTLLAMLVAVPASALLSLLLVALIRHSLLGFGILPISAVWWTFAALLLTGIFSSLRFFLLRHEHFEAITKVSFAQNLARVATQILTGLFKLGWLGLITGEIAGRSSGLRVLLRPFYTVLRDGWRQLNTRDFLRTMNRFRRFPLFSLPSSLVDTAAVTVVLPLLAHYHGAAAAGLFALAQRVLTLPAGLVGQSVADAFHARLSVAARQRPCEIRTVFVRTAHLLTLVSVPPTLLFMCVGRPLFALAFGESWRVAGAIAVAMAPWTLAQLVVSPLSRAVFVLSGQATKLIYDAVSLGLVLLVLVSASRAGYDIVNTVWLISAARVVSYGVYFLVLRRIVHNAEMLASA